MRVSGQQSRIVARFVLCLLLLTSCNRVRDGDTNYVSTSDLSQALIEVADLPTGWSETQRDLFDMRQPENPSIDNSLWCPKASSSLGKLSNLTGDAGADVEMEYREGTGVAVALRLHAWSNEDVREYFSLATRLVEQCDDETWTDAEVSYTENIVDGVEIGDDSISWEVKIASSATSNAFSSTNRITMVLIGDVIGVLQYGRNTTEASFSQPENAAWLFVLDAALKRLEARLP